MPDNQTDQLIRAGLLKGCLGGIGLSIVFMVISGATYLLLAQTALSLNIRLFFGILAGPLLGTIGLLAIVFIRARRAQARMVITPKPRPEPEDND